MSGTKSTLTVGDRLIAAEEINRLARNSRTEVVRLFAAEILRDANDAYSRRERAPETPTWDPNNELPRTERVKSAEYHIALDSVYQESVRLRAQIKEHVQELAKIIRERDEADRRAGAAERKLVEEIKVSTEENGQMRDLLDELRSIMDCPGASEKVLLSSVLNMKNNLTRLDKTYEQKVNDLTIVREERGILEKFLEEIGKVVETSLPYGNYPDLIRDLKRTLDEKSDSLRSRQVRTESLEAMLREVKNRNERLSRVINDISSILEYKGALIEDLPNVLKTSLSMPTVHSMEMEDALHTYERIKDEIFSILDYDGDLEDLPRAVKDRIQDPEYKTLMTKYRNVLNRLNNVRTHLYKRPFLAATPMLRDIVEFHANYRRWQEEARSVMAANPMEDD